MTNFQSAKKHLLQVHSFRKIKVLFYLYHYPFIFTLMYIVNDCLLTGWIAQCKHFHVVTINPNRYVDDDDLSFSRPCPPVSSVFKPSFPLSPNILCECPLFESSSALRACHVTIIERVVYTKSMIFEVFENISAWYFFM